MIVTRRLVLAGAGAVVAGGAAKSRPTTRTWIAYEARLRARLADAGGGGFDAGAEREMLALSNAARRDAGAANLAWGEALAQTARAQAADLAQRAYFDHLSPEGFDPTDRLGLVGRRMLGTTSENIAYHRGTAPAAGRDLFNLWRKSPPHWTNLLRSHHTHAGFGVARLGDRAYAVGLYARPDGELPAPIPFRPREAADLARALRGLGDGYRGLWLEDQVRSGAREALGAAAEGVWRLRLDRMAGEDRWESLFGPIFVLGQAGPVARDHDERH